MTEAAIIKWNALYEIAIGSCNILNSFMRDDSINKYCNDYTDSYPNDPNVLECKDKMINEI